MHSSEQYSWQVLPKTLSINYRSFRVNIGFTRWLKWSTPQLNLKEYLLRIQLNTISYWKTFPLTKEQKLKEDNVKLAYSYLINGCNLCYMCWIVQNTCGCNALIRSDIMVRQNCSRPSQSNCFWLHYSTGVLYLRCAQKTKKSTSLSFISLLTWC